MASGAVVTKDVSPYTIVCGVTAEPTRCRFPEDNPARIPALVWWDWDNQRPRTAMPDFRSLGAEAFLEKKIFKPVVPGSGTAPAPAGASAAPIPHDGFGPGAAQSAALCPTV